MSQSASGLQKQLDALASFCEQCQLTVNLSKAKVVVFEARQSDVCDFVLSGAVEEWGELQVLGVCLPCHQEADFWDRCSGSYSKESPIRNETTMRTSGHTGSSAAMQTV